MRPSPERGQPVLIQVLAHPRFGHHQGPESVGMSSRAAQVLALEPLDGLDLEEAARADPVGRQQLLQGRAQIAAEPVPERDHEALLGMGEHLVG